MVSNPDGLVDSSLRQVGNMLISTAYSVVRMTVQATGCALLSGEGVTNEHILLTNVLLVPYLASNIFSEWGLQLAGCKIVRNGSMVHVWAPGGGLIVVCDISQRPDRMTLIPGAFGARPVAARVIGLTELDIDEAHAIFGHIEERVVRQMAAASNPPLFISGGAMSECMVCVSTKMIRNRQNSDAVRRPPDPGLLIYTDLVGPVSEIPQTGLRYASHIVDAHSRYIDVRCLQGSSGEEIPKHVRSCIERERLRTGLSIKKVRSDYGPRYYAAVLNKYLKDNGIEHEFLSGYHPE
jgi:hypothetical protein